MTIHALLADAPLVQRVGRTLAHTVWQGLAAAVSLRLVLAIVRRSAAVRYAAAVATLAAVSAAACVTFALTGGSTRLTSAGGVGSVPVRTGRVANRLPPAAPAEPLAGATGGVVLLWTVGVAMQGAWQAVGWIHVRRLGRSPVLTDGPWADALPAVADRMRVRRVVRLLASGQVEVPVVLGAFRPTIVVPLSMMSGIPAEHIAAVLAHELAHVRRHDYLLNLVQCGVETAFFYHPAVWWISAVVRRQREHCCDDAAAAAVGGRTSVAAALIALEHGRPGPRLAVGAGGSPLLPRVRRLTTGPGAFDRRAAGLVAVAFALGLVVAGVTAAIVRVSRVEPPDRPATSASIPTETPAESSGEVMITGDARAVGVYSRTVRMTAQELIRTAGEPADGRREWVSVYRKTFGDKVVVTRYRYADLMAAGASDVYLNPLDIVQVSTFDPTTRPVAR